MTEAVHSGEVYAGDGTWCKYLLDQLNIQRCNIDAWCDTNITTDDGLSFPAHSVVLAASSHILHTVFPPRSQGDYLLHLSDTTGSTVKHFLDFLYTGRMCCNILELEGVVVLAQNLEVDKVIKATNKVLLTKLKSTELKINHAIHASHVDGSVSCSDNVENQIRVEYNKQTVNAHQNISSANIHLVSTSATATPSTPNSKQSNTEDVPDVNRLELIETHASQLPAENINISSQKISGAVDSMLSPSVVDASNMCAVLKEFLDLKSEDISVDDKKLDIKSMDDENPAIFSADSVSTEKVTEPVTTEKSTKSVSLVKTTIPNVQFDEKDFENKAKRKTCSRRQINGNEMEKKSSCSTDEEKVIQAKGNDEVISPETDKTTEKVKGESFTNVPPQDDKTTVKPIIISPSMESVRKSRRILKPSSRLKGYEKWSDKKEEVEKTPESGAKFDMTGELDKILYVKVEDIGRWVTSGTGSETSIAGASEENVSDGRTTTDTIIEAPTDEEVVLAHCESGKKSKRLTKSKHESKKLKLETKPMKKRKCSAVTEKTLIKQKTEEEASEPEYIPSPMTQGPDGDIPVTHGTDYETQSARADSGAEEYLPTCDSTEADRDDQVKEKEEQKNNTLDSGEIIESDLPAEGPKKHSDDNSGNKVQKKSAVDSGEPKVRKRRPKEKARLTCKFCGKTFTCNTSRKTHEYKHENIKPFKCSFCDETFVVNSQRVTHERIHTGEKPYQCSFCGNHFRDAAVMRIHEKRHAQKLSAWRCEICGHNCESRKSLQEHQIAEHGQIHMPHICEVCNKPFQKADQLKIHLKVHNKAHMCAYCGNTYATPHQVEIHTRTHTGEKPHKCDVCPMAYTSLVGLKNHAKKHTGEPDNYCSYCDKKFWRKYELDLHERTHTGERPFMCKICGQRFRCCSHLRVHERTHSTKRPFKCDQCDRAFRDNFSLKIHLKCHETKYKCDICGRYFRTYAAFQKHENFHNAAEDVVMTPDYIDGIQVKETITVGEDGIPVVSMEEEQTVIDQETFVLSADGSGDHSNLVMMDNGIVTQLKVDGGDMDVLKSEDGETVYLQIIDEHGET